MFWNISWNNEYDVALSSLSLLEELHYIYFGAYDFNLSTNMHKLETLMRALGAFFFFLGAF